MKNEESVTLVYARADRKAEWERLGTGKRIILVRNSNILAAAIAIAVSDKASDVRKVIFDHTIGSDRFLDLLADLPHEFLGDVLALFEDGSAYLSAAAAHQNGRMIYRLEPADVDFYLEIHFRIFAPAMAAATRFEKHSLALAS